MCPKSSRRTRDRARRGEGEPGDQAQRRKGPAFTPQPRQHPGRLCSAPQPRPHPTTPPLRASTTPLVRRLGSAPQRPTHTYPVSRGSPSSQYSTPPPPPAPLMSPPAPAQVRPRLFPHMPQDASVRGSLGLPREGSCRSAAVLPSRLPHSPPQSQHSEGVGASRLGLLLLSRGAGVRPLCGAPRAGEAPASHSLDAGKVGNALSSRAFTAFSFSLLTILGGRSVISIQRRDPNTNWLALDHSIVRK